MSESAFQRELIKQLKVLFPGCVVLKNDPNYIQGIPDLLVLFKDKWAALEVKVSKRASRRPNQEHYITLLDGMSFASFIYPENKEDVLNDLQLAFGTTR